MTDIRERRLRRVAQARGYRLIRFTRRDSNGRDHQGFLIIDLDENSVVLGAEPTKLDDVEEYLMDGPAPRRKRRAAG